MVDEGEEEEVEENDLDCEGELGDMDVESPPWNFYGDDDIDCDDEIDDQEDTALLRASAAKTEIVITPMSPVSLSFSSEIDLILTIVTAIFMGGDKALQSCTLLACCLLKCKKILKFGKRAHERQLNECMRALSAPMETILLLKLKTNVVITYLFGDGVLCMVFEQIL